MPATDPNKAAAIAADVLRLDVQDIYNNHMQCEGLDFLLAMLTEGIYRLNVMTGEDTSRLLIRGLQQDLKC